MLDTRIFQRRLGTLEVKVENSAGKLICSSCQACVLYKGAATYGSLVARCTQSSRSRDRYCFGASLMKTLPH